ncbi:flagellar assembly protein FliH [Virgibacillus natechei]|uniref:Flagellar assembly protein FliH n=1 Tax=Virgibacillus natechei TaxID=1216297 RepID=A0ABS4IAZ5_9BACI|nr:flagellar assembly protein FliH [Virgibacillus natechei]MBP1968102.1 flagellar assembly protein FliH [Virgibacillus natechei]UZD14618.1 flagellar assembly protein FliH [Virgibacillus natechei]
MSSHTQNRQSKVIELKPIEVTKKAPNQTLDLEVEDSKVKDEIQNARDELQKIEQQKKQHIADTKSEIENARQNWKNEKKQFIEAAKEEGYNAGFSQGKEEGILNYQHLIDKANSIMEEAIKDFHSTIEKSDEAILGLAIHIADTIMKQKLTEDPRSFLSIVKAAIKELKDQSVITIYLHPNNYEYVIQQKDELELILESETNLSIYVDESVKENGCVIEHPFGQIDAGTDTQLQQIRKVLYEIATENK